MLKSIALDKKNTAEEHTYSDDPNAAQRKQDHIAMAFDAQVARSTLDSRFYYEPMLSAHPTNKQIPSFSFSEKKLHVPIWVSSMTGGTDWAKTINENLARVCKDFGMGMGLGSCRSLLTSDDRKTDFAVRHLIGDSLPLYANLGIAQVEQIMIENKWEAIVKLVEMLEADGLIIHVNPLQEWLQPEGDRFQYAPIDVIKEALEKLSLPIIVKEVGQGFGPESLKALLSLPLAAVDFGASGGTNFSKLELFRSDERTKDVFQNLALVGHDAIKMLQWTNEIVEDSSFHIQCQQLIISGGIRSFLDGYYCIEKVKIPAIYGQASSFLRHARGSYDDLFAYVKAQVEGLKLAYAYLKVY